MDLLLSLAPPVILHAKEDDSGGEHEWLVLPPFIAQLTHYDSALRSLRRSLQQQADHQFG